MRLTSRGAPPAALCAAMRAGEMVKMYYTYVLKSLKDNELYIGWTVDLRARVTKHYEGKVFSTKLRLPMILLYYEACLSRKKAIDREKQLKSGYGRRYLKNRL